MSPTLNAAGTLSFLLWCSWCDCRHSSTGIWTIERANWDSFEMSLKYWNRCEFDSSLRVGDGLSCTSNGNLNSLPTAVKLRTASVPMIGAQFYANWAVLAVWTNPLCVPLSVPAIVSTLFTNLWNLSTDYPLWFDLVRTQYLMHKISHISLKTPLKGLPSSNTTTAHIPNVSTTCSMNFVARCANVMLEGGVAIANWVISHMELRRYPLLPFSSTMTSPGDHKSTCIIQKGTVIGHEKWVSLFQFLQTL